jgi:CheY-like chemotaxis protein
VPNLSALTPLHGRRLLVVEDDYLIADELRDELTGAGAEVIGPVPTVARALQIMGSHATLDGAILDINLGGEKVFPLVDVLRQRGIPCVFMTGYDRQAIPAVYANVPLCKKPAGAREAAEALGLR